MYLEISNTLKTMVTEQRIDLVELSACALYLSQELPMQKHTLEAIVRNSEFKLVFQPINGGSTLGETFSHTSKITNKKHKLILIEEDIPKYQKRFLAGREFALCMMGKWDEYRGMSLLSPIEKMIAETFSMFMFLPFTAVVKELATYTDEGKSIPKKSSEWLNYLHVIAELPYEVVAIGFEHIRMISVLLQSDFGFNKNTFVDQKKEMLAVLEQNKALID